MLGISSLIIISCVSDGFSNIVNFKLSRIEGHIRVNNYLSEEISSSKIQDIGLVDFVKSEHYLNLVNQVLGLKESPKNFICKRCSSPGG